MELNIRQDTMIYFIIGYIGSGLGVYVWFNGSNMPVTY